MAKGNMLMGMARGKVGDVVFYRMEGEQMARMRNRHIKNPRSEAQQVQRAIAATVTQAYSQLSGICDHSFENVPYGAKSMFYFNKVNMDMLRSLALIDYKAEFEDYYDYNALFGAQGVSSIVCNRYKVSEGSLDCAVIVDNDSALYPRISPRFSETSKASLKFGTFIDKAELNDATQMVTYIEIAVVGNPLVNMPEGTSGEFGCQVFGTSVKYGRLRRNYAVISDEDRAKLLTDENEALLLEKYFDEYDKDLFDSIINNSLSGEHVMKSVWFDTDSVIMGATIKSELFQGSWKRSTSYMQYTRFNSPYEWTNGLVLPRMIENWTADSETIGESEWYLNGGQ